MTAGVIIAIAIASATGGGVLGILGTNHFAGKAADAAAAEYTAALDTKEGEVNRLTGELATCEAKITPEAIDATGRVLAAAQATEIADTTLRASVVAAMPQQLLAEAVIATGSPRMIAAESAMARCTAANTTGDSARGGCAKEVPTAWAAAVDALAACPEPTSPAPDQSATAPE